MKFLLALAILASAIRPAAADFAAAEAAERSGDSAAAYQACRAEAESGDAHCQNLLGVVLERGRGVAQDLSEAIRFFQLAAAQGLAEAQHNLGHAYEDGIGVRKDEAEAAHWYRLAAEQGDPAALNSLGLLNATGRGGTRDPEAALALFRRAATSGYTLAQLNLAMALDHGRKMPHDRVRAYIWYSIAARQVSDPVLRDKAAQGRDRLAGKIAPADLLAARSAALTWSPGAADPGEGVAESPPPRSRLVPVGPRPSSGASGFIVSRAGDVITNRHVVDGCRELRVLRDGKASVATVVADDRVTDLAILRLPEPAAEAALLRGDNPVKPGETVVAIGYPLQGYLSSQASVTAGIISGLEGPHDDPHLLQITAPVQPGSSGSPLIDASGAVTGVVVAKINGWRLAQKTGAIPENVNFAIDAKYVRPFLDRSGVVYETAKTEDLLSMPAIAERGLKFAVMVQCFN